MSRMADLMAELCGNCDKKFETCGKDINVCFREYRDRLVKQANDRHDITDYGCW